MAMLNSLADIQNRLGCNDQAALKLLYDQFSNKLFQFAFAIIHSKEVAEEIVEDVFIRVWQKRARIAKVENLTWYLYITTRNISFNYHRKFSKVKYINLDEITLPFYQLDCDPEQLMISTELLQHINRAINELPPRCRLIFKLVKEDGLKYRQVADLLGLSAKTVENQMGIALKLMHRAVSAVTTPVKIIK
jgi:RNA polymerase sigma-70 factor (ECF subfamily)